VADRKAQCSKHRETLLEIFLAEGEQASLPPELNRHLGSCDTCSRYWQSLGAIRTACPQEPLYSPFLRAKTLRHLTDQERALNPGQLLLVTLAALTSISFSFVLPGWLLARLFMHWTASSAVAGGAAMGVLLIIGALTTVVSALSLMEGGFIHFGDGEGIQGMGAIPSTTGDDRF